MNARKGDSPRSVDPTVWKACSEIAEVVSASVPASMMYGRIVSVLDDLVGFDVGTILSGAPAEPWSTAFEKGDTSVMRRNAWRYMAEATPEEIQRLGFGFTLDTDVFDARRRDRLAVYREFMFPNRLAAGMIRYFVMDGRMWFIGLSRARASFSGRTRSQLHAIFPHLRAALRAVTWRANDEHADPTVAGIGAAWSLTPAQQRVVTYVIRGLTNEETAGLLGISKNTVRNTLAHVFQKVGVSRRSELAFLVRSGEVVAPARIGQRDLESRRQLVTIVGGPPVASTAPERAAFKKT